jgi:hypothetical protein
MKAECATFLTETFGVEVTFDAKRGLSFKTEQSGDMQAALRSVADAISYYEHITSLKDGKQYKLLSRQDDNDAWTEILPGFDVCNDAVLKAATLSKDPKNGTIQVYDALRNREIMYFPAGGLS